MSQTDKNMKNTIVSPKYGDSGVTSDSLYKRWLTMKKFGTLKERFLMRKGRGD